MLHPKIYWKKFNESVGGSVVDGGLAGGDWKFLGGSVGGCAVDGWVEFWCWICLENKSLDVGCVIKWYSIINKVDFERVKCDIL